MAARRKAFFEKANIVAIHLQIKLPTPVFGRHSSALARSEGIQKHWK
jgi:hypothetical protein